MKTIKNIIGRVKEFFRKISYVSMYEEVNRGLRLDSVIGEIETNIANNEAAKIIANKYRLKLSMTKSSPRHILLEAKADIVNLYAVR